MTASVPERVGAPAASLSLNPVSEAERIASLDVLRGFALLGILMMNIEDFAMIEAVFFNPTAYGDLRGANYWVWLMTRILVDLKFWTIFSMLFGAGILLMASRIESTGKPSAAVHYRRMGWLILFGILHAYLLWHGDILYLYGMCGLVVYLFRNLPPRRLLMLGLVSFAVPSVIMFAAGRSMLSWPPDQLQKLTQEFWLPTPAEISRELAAYRGNWLAQMSFRVPSAFQFETGIFLTWGFWRAAGLMLIGMALLKLDVLSAKRTSALYWGMIGVGVLVGIPIVSYGVHRNFAAQWDVRYSLDFGSQYNYWASPVVAIGWVGIVMLACKLPTLAPLNRALMAVGRMAFSNYILDTILCTTLFYGHGFGLFGKVERVGQLGIVAAIWMSQLAVSPVWLRHFRFGPLEWLWRSLTYLRLQPFRRTPSASQPDRPSDPHDPRGSSRNAGNVQ